MGSKPRWSSCALDWEHPGVVAPEEAAAFDLVLGHYAAMDGRPAGFRVAVALALFVLSCRDGLAGRLSADMFDVLWERTTPAVEAMALSADDSKTDELRAMSASILCCAMPAFEVFPKLVHQLDANVAKLILQSFQRLTSLGKLWTGEQLCMVLRQVSICRLFDDPDLPLSSGLSFTLHIFLYHHQTKSIEANETGIFDAAWLLVQRVCPSPQDSEACLAVESVDASSYLFSCSLTIFKMVRNLPACASASWWDPLLSLCIRSIKFNA